MGSSTSTLSPSTPWFVTSPEWRDHHKSQLLAPTIDPSPEVTLPELIEKSAQFPRKFPVESVRCHQLSKTKIPEDLLERNINSTYPVIHEHALYLCSMFLAHKKNSKDGTFYQNMTLLDLIDRLLSKRAVSFLGPIDHYMLLDGTTGTGGWDTVGTDTEKQPLVLENCLSYDEMKLSAFLSISSHTVFINDGSRRNRGIFEEDRTKIEDDGIIMGLIGTRLHRRNVMEYQEVVKTENQNIKKFGYGDPTTFQGQIMNFYGDNHPVYKHMIRFKMNSERYFNVSNYDFFDRITYSRRIALSIDTLLIEANDRAKRLNKMAYVHVVGLGLGTWRMSREQDKLFMETFTERIKLLLEVLTNISDICFAYIAHKMAGEHQHGDKIGNIKLHMVDKKDPHSKLTGEDSGKLLVVSFAWDSNSLPGNEFWLDSLDTSSDSAAASSTQVAELHNWHINGRVRGRNLRVATLKGLVTFQEYQKMHSEG